MCGFSSTVEALTGVHFGCKGTVDPGGERRAG